MKARSKKTIPFKEEIAKIDFDELIKEFRVFDLENFSNYLINVWKDLSIRSDNQTLGVNKLTFSQVSKRTPFII